MGFTSNARHAHTRAGILPADIRPRGEGSLGEVGHRVAGRWHKGQVGEGSPGDKGHRSVHEQRGTLPWDGEEAIGTELGLRSTRVVGFGRGNHIRLDGGYSHEEGRGGHSRPWEGGRVDGWETGSVRARAGVHQAGSTSSCQTVIFGAGEYHIRSYVSNTLNPLSLELAAIELLHSSLQVCSGLKLDKSIDGG